MNHDENHFVHSFFSVYLQIDDDIGRQERRRRFSIGEAIGTFLYFLLLLGRIYKDEPHPAHQEHVKKLGDYIRFSNEGKPTKAEQLKRVFIFVFAY